MSNFKINKQAGMTLVELMIGLAIVSVLFALALPSYSTWIQNSQIRTAADSIQNGLQIARQEALSRNTIVGFQLTDATKSDWRVCVGDPPPFPTPCPLGPPDAQIQARAGADGSANVSVGADVVVGALAVPLVAGSNLPNGEVIFNGFGRVANPGVDLARIDLRNDKLAVADERVLVLLINVGGQVRMCDPKLSIATSSQGCV